jgi:hypothetical protein
MVHPVNPLRLSAIHGDGAREAGGGEPRRPGGTVAPAPVGGGDTYEPSSRLAAELRVMLANHEAAGAGVGDLETAQALLLRLGALLQSDAPGAVRAQAGVDGSAALRLLI